MVKEGSRMQCPKPTSRVAEQCEQERHSGRKSRIAVAVLWLVGTVQFFVAQLVVEASWDTRYSWADNNISDLAETACRHAPEDGRWICSPLHPLMNASFMLTGVLLALGALLFMRALNGNLMSRVALSALIVTGAAWVMVGVYPADVNENLHVLGAIVIFVVGNIALVLYGWGAHSMPTIVRVSSIALGVIGFAAAFLHLGGAYLGLGMGGMERVTAFTVPIWMLIIASLLLAAERRMFDTESRAQHDHESQKSTVRGTGVSGGGLLS
ncbi:DUF998 domain-containing protein [Phytoactinopolyspora mesophila]|uniref:DUF998 domain-containing protein n=1 Tax=Phytoactinopolyspora mesophila TaxID=2650750 RepID=A0A7K3MB70_9ACTN|nr:DUF998 domain-containing protein [Phytoactinopolyspora mesophila]NDL60544.1 DUF998 domain-containing protein [Phytoactinopolyspora mesophila]